MSKKLIISSDSHVVEPPDLWTDRMDPKYGERIPHLVKGDPYDQWYCDGEGVGVLGGISQAGKRYSNPEEITLEGSFADVPPGGYNPHAHVQDLDVDGVYADVLYPSVGLNLYAIPDPEFMRDVFRAYNDWLAEFCKPFPNKLKGIAMLDIDDLPAGIKELERCANMGLAGAMITCYPREGLTYDTPEYDPLWAAAQDLGMPLGLHIGTNRPGPGQTFVFDELTPAFLANADYWVRMSLAQMIYSGVFARYPKLQVGAVEMELSWVPHFIDRLDYNYTQRARDLFKKGYWDRYPGDMLPSQYFHRNVFLGFQEDALGIQHRHIIGVDNLQWGSDYPHPEATFPRTRQILEDILAGCTEEEKAKIAGGNAARVYHFD